MQRACFKLAFLYPRYWLLWLGLGILWLITLLPYRLLLVLGKMVGRLMYCFAGSRRRIIERNLELCFPNYDAAQRQQLVKANFASNGIALFEMAISWWWPQWRLKRLANISGLEHLQQAQAAGDGVVLMAFHFTTLEIGAALLGQRHTIDGMYRRHSNALFDFVQRRGRERHNKDASAIERDDVRAMIKSLRKGRAIWYAPDQDYGAGHSLFAPFFGIPTATVTATTKFVRLGKAKVILLTQQRLADGRGYQLTVHPPLENFPTASEQQDCERINQLVEQAILTQPDQYLWAHRRFKTRPPGQPSLYA